MMQHPRLFIIAVVLGLLLCTALWFVVSPPNVSSQHSQLKNSHMITSSYEEANDAYDFLLNSTRFGDVLLYSDNLNGRIVWNEAYFMESLLNMYEATSDQRYLDIFIKHADHVLSIRDDRAGRPDYAGRLRPGWQTGSYYTLGIPVIIPDEEGKPSLEVQAVRSAGNDHTVVEILPDEDQQFTLIARNDFRRIEPIVVIFENLTLETAEKVINANLTPASLIRVRSIGDAPPIRGVWPLNETYRMVLHELHTPIIGTPLLRFSDLVFREKNLSSYRQKAEEYVHAFEESAKDYESSWRQDPEGGFFIFEPGGKYWASGLEVPYNALSANGRFFLLLYRTTGDIQYLERANALARKVRAGMIFHPDGTMTMPYWVRDSLPFKGWKNRTSNPVNGLYPECSPNLATEDISHFTLTLRFMVEAWQMGVVFEDEDLEAVARTFKERLWRPSSVMAGELCDPDWRKGFYLAHNLDGKSHAYDYAAATFALLSRWDATILSHALEVYRSRYSNINCVDKDYLYGEAMLGWSVLAGGGELWMGKLQEKPLYPFTLRCSADQYVKNSRLISLDDSGVPVTDYGSLHGGAGKRYNPTFISNYALALYRDFLSTKDLSLLEAFNTQVHWLLEHKTQRQYKDVDFWVWEFDFGNPTFEAKAPWVSALSQGRVLSVFLAAYDLANEPRYLQAAEYAFRSFLVPASEGGVSTFENNVAWYEEVADYDAPSAKILNGHIAAVQGLWTFWKWTGREDVKRYLDLGIAAVKRDIASYDAGFLSYYSQYPTNPRIYAPAGGYNTFHVHQLLWLYDVTSESVFLDYALRFASYDSPSWNITTAGSTDPVGHGPDKLFFQMGSQFWSHNQFPTWVCLDLQEPKYIDGIVIFGYTSKSTPRDLDVLVSENGEDWIKTVERINNTEIHIIERFEPVLARFVKVVIFNDNGNNNVALTGIAVLGDAAAPMAVSDWVSFSSGNLPVRVFGEGWNIPENGWIFLAFEDPMPEDIFIDLVGCGKQCYFTVLETGDFEAYRAVTPDIYETGDGRNVALHNLSSSYLKIVFHKGCKGGRLTVRDFS